jgi:ATPase subunit of ABC transporter with duplicated ATPase domains
LEKLENEGLIEKPIQRKQLKIKFPERGRSGRTVLAIKNLQFGFGNKVSVLV